MNQTNRLRMMLWVVWFAATVSGIVAFWLDKDPAKLTPVLGWVTGALAVGEAANVGKRATFNIDAVKAER